MQGGFSKLNPAAWSWGGPACPASLRSDPLPLGLQGRQWEEESEKRLESPGTEAGAPRGSAGLLSARAFHSSHVLSVSYLTSSSPEPR